MTKYETFRRSNAPDTHVADDEEMNLFEIYFKYFKTYLWINANPIAYAKLHNHPGMCIYRCISRIGWGLLILAVAMHTVMN